MKWNKKGLIFQPSDAPEFNFTHLQGPVAVNLDNKVRVFFGSRVKDGSGRVFYIDLDADDPKRILKIQGRSVLDVGALGTFDQNGVIQVSVNKSGDDLFMYYVGFSKMASVPHTCMIGLAISKDGGDTFQKYSEGPVFPISTKDPYLLGSGDVVFHDGKWHMIYTSGTRWIYENNSFEYTYVLKYAFSQDGINWVPTGSIAISPESEYHAYTSPSIFKIEDTFHMYFSVRHAFGYRQKGKDAYHFGYATSKDLINWKRQDADGGILPSQQGWDSEMICYSNVIRLKDRLIMFHNGNGFGRSGLGYAISD